MTVDVPLDLPLVPTQSAPFFMLGCVRSGTTMLRDALRMHPNLAGPEETHFYRWGEPYGTEAMTRTLTNNVVLKRHREIDGITEPEFVEMLKQCTSRAELYWKYMTLYIHRKKPGATRWFDKTPQNVYGAMLAASSMPRARFSNSPAAYHPRSKGLGIASKSSQSTSEAATTANTKEAGASR
mgnify:CR=1 FL=1